MIHRPELRNPAKKGRSDARPAWPLPAGPLPGVARANDFHVLKAAKTRKRRSPRRPRTGGHEAGTNEFSAIGGSSRVAVHVS